jgi:LuxR family maltose regulon positive regulatory protein
MSAILTTKLHVPPLRSGHVPRPRLLAPLNAGPDCRLTLVSAPAGYGKTTLVVEWLAQSQGPGRKVAWVSLDEQDNDPVRFVTHLVAALRRVSEGVGEAALSLMQAPQPPPPEAVIGSLINDLASLPSPFVLALDDYHVIHEMSIHRQLGFLVEHQPPQVRLVMITREDPPLPLARLRARGQMVEIRQQDLRFSREECAAFLTQAMGLQVAPPDIAALERRTEGWIAGLQLAGLSMQGREDLPGYIEAFTGSSRYVLDYLIGEVLEQQPAEVQDFLMRTSILGRLTSGLCDAVTQREDSQRILQMLDQRNLFVVPLDQSRTWYRYHHLFAELLAQRLRSTQAQAETGLHRRAGEWFAAEGLVPEAIHHALAAPDWERAADLVEGESVTMLRRGELVSLLGWLKALPPDVVLKRPELSRDYGWALTLTGQLEAAERFLQSAEAAAGGDHALLGTILVAQAYHLRARGDNAGAIERGQRALDLLPESDPLSRSLVALTLGLSHWSRGSLEEAETALQEVDRAGRQSRNHYARMTALSYLGVIQGIHGRLRGAAEMCRQAIEIGGQSPPVAPAHIELGALLYEWNDLEPAAHHLQIGIELSQRTGNVMILSDAYHSLAILQQARGEAGAAQATLQLADRLADDHEVTPLTRLRNAACHVQLALASGDMAGAQHWAEQVTGSADASPFFPLLGLTPARLLLASGENARAAEMLAGLHETARRAGWASGEIEVRAVQAMAAPAPSEALGFLADALQRAQPEGFVRTFVDKGEPMRLLLERLRSEGGERKEYLLGLLAAFGGPGKVLASQTLVEPMSERELEILRLLADGLSNQGIARRLVISVGTAKSHVHHILGKLNSDSRMQAVAKARELGLL